MAGAGQRGVHLARSAIGRLSRGCASLGVFFVLVQALGHAYPEPPAAPALIPADPQLAEVLEVLARRAPELSTSTRERTAKALVEEARTAGFEPRFVLAVIAVESNFDKHAVSPVGARGIMQFMPKTLGWFSRLQGVKLSPEEILEDPALSVRLGVRYLASLHRMFGGRTDMALMAYNAGPNRIRQAMRGRGLDRYREYVRFVERDEARLRRGQLGPDFAERLGGTSTTLVSVADALPSSAVGGTHEARAGR